MCHKGLLNRTGLSRGFVEKIGYGQCTRNPLHPHKPDIEIGVGAKGRKNKSLIIRMKDGANLCLWKSV